MDHCHLLCRTIATAYDAADVLIVPAKLLHEGVSSQQVHCPCEEQGRSEYAELFLCSISIAAMTEFVLTQNLNMNLHSIELKCLRLENRETHYISRPGGPGSTY